MPDPREFPLGLGLSRQDIDRIWPIWDIARRNNSLAYFIKKLDQWGYRIVKKDGPDA